MGGTAVKLSPGGAGIVPVFASVLESALDAVPVFPSVLAWVLESALVLAWVLESAPVSPVPPVLHPWLCHHLCTHGSVTSCRNL